jgi:hypothetical protein
VSLNEPRIQKFPNLRMFLIMGITDGIFFEAG